MQRTTIGVIAVASVLFAGVVLMAYTANGGYSPLTGNVTSKITVDDKTPDYKFLVVIKNSTWSKYVRADINGIFQFKNVPYGKYRIGVQNNSYSSDWYFKDLTINEPDETIPMRLGLYKPYLTVKTTTYNGHTPPIPPGFGLPKLPPAPKLPAPRAVSGKITVNGQTPDSSFLVVVKSNIWSTYARMDSAGAYKLKNVDNGTYRIGVQNTTFWPEWLFANVTVKNGSTYDLVIQYKKWLL